MQSVFMLFQRISKTDTGVPQQENDATADAAKRLARLWQDEQLDFSEKPPGSLYNGSAKSEQELWDERL